MYCKKCGAGVENGYNFCKVCGSRIENNNENININQTTTTTNQNEQINYNFKEQPNNINNQTKNTKAIVSLVLGIICILAVWLLNVLIIPLAIIGLIFGIIEKNKSGIKTTGIILNIVSIALSIIIILIMILFVGKVMNGIDIDYTTTTNTFYGDGYTIEYDEEWIEETKSDGTSYLKTDKDSYFLPIGTSSLTEYTDYLNCDFKDYSCKTKLYDWFYDYWSKSLSKQEIYLYKDSYGFSVLEDDIYYATYNYGKSSSKLNGKYYLIVTSKKNIILSFMTNTTNTKVNSLHYDVIDLLEEIEIDYYNSYEEDNTVVDEDLYNTLNSLSNWNRYSHLRTGNLGKKKTIEGGWRVLSEYESYWEFKDGKFWWYKSFNDLDDNYWYGTTKIVKGKEGLASVGIDSSKADDIIKRSNGNVTANDIYTIVCTPEKIIADGIDKSSTNIEDGATWKYVFVVVDHGDEGIECQAINLSTSEVAYYVKLKDY